MSHEVFERESFAVGEVIFKAGDLPRFAYIVQSGMVEISTERDGKNVRLGVVGPGELLGKMALVDALPRSATFVGPRAKCGCGAPCLQSPCLQPWGACRYIAAASGSSSAWQSTTFGTWGPEVQILSPRPASSMG